ncbi:G2/M phase-specific E3 ubiquitin-protein ligase [Labeo rohita]|uniref:G2/M phase-specific E3 ubiquitin-protein ligase n=1 Tax=Labeo rohita TaxID=84645 RepID=A0ABQ8MSL0_LABRO|nr:G2/M phase-specific E3 ubiquitin-protein ligase [Labeo rohita]
MFSLSFYQQPEYALIESAARNLLSLITGTLGQEQQVQVQGQGQSQSRVLTLTQSGRQNQQMTKSVPAPSKHTSLQFYLLPVPTDRTPQGSLELKLVMAGLGRSGQRKLTVIPPESEGYTAKLLKSSCNNGRHMLFIVPIQDEIDTQPLPFDAPEFIKMPKSQCKMCGESLPLQALALHVESCSKPDSDHEAEDDESSDCLEASTQNVCNQCPEWDLSDIETDTAEEAGPSGRASQTTNYQNLPTTSASLSDFTDEAKDWKIVPGPIKAAELFRQSVLKVHASEKPLYLHMDLTSSISDQEATLITFYKACNVKWACPLKTRLEGNANITRIFDGEPDQLVPSSSACLVDSDLFLMAGKMIGHCFLHGGPPLSGLSPAVVHVISGGNAETAVVHISDCPYFDLRKKIMLLEGDSELTPEEKESINELCFSWDLPRMNSANRRWLYERLLHHAVIGRTMRQIKQLRKGLKETMLWPLICQHPDVVPFIFPREKNDFVLNCIIWPSMVENNDEDDDECSLEDRSRVAGYLPSSPEPKALIKFWVGKFLLLPSKWRRLHTVTYLKHLHALRPYGFHPDIAISQHSRKNC